MSSNPETGTGAVGAGEERSRVLTPEQVVTVARDIFLRHGSLDMQELVRRLAVSRATLYRVVSSRERVLADVIWSLATMSLRAAIDQTRGKMDLHRVLRIGSRFRDAALESESLTKFVLAEPSTAAAVLHTRSPRRNELVDAWNDLLVEAIEAQGSPLKVDPKHAAEIIVNLGASTLYADISTGKTSSPDLVAVVLRSLLS